MKIILATLKIKVCELQEDYKKKKNALEMRVLGLENELKVRW